MIRVRGVARAAVVAAMVVGLCSSAGLAVVQYTVTDLGTLGGTTRPYRINSNGQVVGFSFVPAGFTHAFLWDHGVMSDLGTLGGDGSGATGINDAGDVVGYSRISTSNNTLRAFLWHNSSMTDLGTLTSPTGLDYRAYGISSSGQVVGHAYTVGAYDYAFSWEGGVMKKVPALGESYSIARDISSNGVIVGDAYLSDYATYSRAFIWVAGQVTSLGTLGGSYSLAYGVNDFSQVVGEASLPNGDMHAFLWADGAMTDLGTLGASSSTANDINGIGQVVGYARIPSGATHAFLWQNGQISDLNDLLPTGSGWVLTSARGINDQGWIVGSGSYLGGPEQGFLLTPEPATLSLLTLGGLGMWLRRRRRK